MEMMILNIALCLISVRVSQGSQSDDKSCAKPLVNVVSWFHKLISLTFWGPNITKQCQKDKTTEDINILNLYHL